MFRKNVNCEMNKLDRGCMELDRGCMEKDEDINVLNITTFLLLIKNCVRRNFV